MIFGGIHMLRLRSVNVTILVYGPITKNNINQVLSKTYMYQVWWWYIMFTRFIECDFSWPHITFDLHHKQLKTSTKGNAHTKIDIHWSFTLELVHLKGFQNSFFDLLPLQKTKLAQNLLKGIYLSSLKFMKAVQGEISCLKGFQVFT